MNPSCWHLDVQISDAPVHQTSSKCNPDRGDGPRSVIIKQMGIRWCCPIYTPWQQVQHEILVWGSSVVSRSCPLAFKIRNAHRKCPLPTCKQWISCKFGRTCLFVVVTPIIIRQINCIKHSSSVSDTSPSSLNGRECQCEPADAIHR
jgi:hypothetical protein